MKTSGGGIAGAGLGLRDTCAVVVHIFHIDDMCQCAENCSRTICQVHRTTKETSKGDTVTTVKKTPTVDIMQQEDSTQHTEREMSIDDGAGPAAYRAYAQDAQAHGRAVHVSHEHNGQSTG